MNLGLRKALQKASVKGHLRQTQRSEKKDRAGMTPEPFVSADTAAQFLSVKCRHLLALALVSRRYERHSIVITTNKAFKEWNTVFPNATSIATLLDRLTHHTDVTLLEGQSYRVRESEIEIAARRKKA